MGRKPQVGDVWRLADATVVAVDDDDDSVTIDFGPEGNFGLLAEELLAHATLVKAAERPLAVGDMVRLAPKGHVGEIIAIVGERAWVEFRNGIGAIRDLGELIRAEPT